MLLARLPLGILLIILFASHAQAQNVLLWKWKPGDKLTYVLEDNYSCKSEVGGDKSSVGEDGVFDLNQTLILDTTWHVKSVGSNGEAGIVVTIDRVRFTAGRKGVAAMLLLDSKDAKKPENGPDNVLESLAGAQIALTVSAQGNISKFELPMAVVATVEGNTARELAGFFGDVFTAGGVRHRLTNWLMALPHEPVSEKESWQEDKLSRLGKSAAVCVHSYTLAASVLRDGHTLMKIDVKPQLKLLAENGGKQKPKQKITEQDGKGVVYFDSQTGRITESVLTHRSIIERSVGDFFFSKTTLDSKTTVKLAPEPKR